MGVLDLLCVTTDPDATTFYGLAYAEDYGSSPLKPQYAVLVKSNTNPSSPTDLTWSVVSMLDGSHLSGYPQAINAIDTSCSYSAKGVFTMLGRHKPALSPTEIMVPFGIRYDPAGTMDPRFGLKGSGAWMNITISEGFTWSGPFRRYFLGYPITSANSALILASISDTNNTISLATLNESTMTLAPTAAWNMNSETQGKSLQALTIANDRVYSYALGADYMSVPIMTGFPLTTVSPTTPVGTRYNISMLLFGGENGLRTCYFSPTPIIYVNHGSLTLLCGNERDPAKTSASYTIKDPINSIILDRPVWFDADVINMEYFVPIGPGSGASTFALIRKEGSMYAFGNDGGFRYTHMIDSVNVTDTIRSNPNPSLGPSSRLSTGGIVGIVAGAVVIVAGIVFLLVRRYRIRRNKGENVIAAADQEQSSFAGDEHISFSSMKMGDDGGLNSLYLEGKYLEDSNPEWRTGPTDLIPMAPTTPIPEHLQKEMKALQEKMHAVQEKMQAFSLSSHPQPSAAITISYDGRRSPSTASGKPPRATIKTTQPSDSKFYASSAGSSESLDLHSPIAPAYASAITQPSVQGSPDSHFQESVGSNKSL